MAASPESYDYFLAQPGLFVIPIDELTADGVTARFATELVGRSLMDPPGVELFNASFALYHARSRELYRRAPSHWLPPRLQHVCVATEPVRPYFQPFHRSSWLLDAGDFTPKTSSVEFAAFQFVNAERMAFLGQVAPALLASLAWFLALDDGELAAFVDGCRKTARPDAAGYRALADAIPAVSRLYHASLRPPVIPQPFAGDLPHGLLATATERAELSRLEAAWSVAAVDVVRSHRARHSAPSPTAGRRVATYLADSQPALVVTAGEGPVLWHPGAPEATENVLEALTGVTAAAEGSILEDLATVDRSTRAFLECVRDPAALVDPAPYITAGGLSHIDRAFKLVAYDLGSGTRAGAEGPASNEHRLWEIAPPFERLMLAARTVHEWGHLAAESGWIGVPQGRRKERADALRSLSAAFDDLRASAPEHVQRGVAQEVARHAAEGRSLGQGIVRSLRQRIEDYQANLLARRVLEPDQMETYVRNNVGSRAGEYGLPHVFHELARAVYELQYLRLARIADPVEWFIGSTWFEERFVGPRIVTRDRFVEMARLLASVCDMYVFDHERLDLSRRPDFPLTRL